MSSTQLYKFTKAGNAIMFAEVHNSWRGAMAVWTGLEKKYLPLLYPYGPDRAFSRFTINNGKEQEVWNLWKDSRLLKAEKITLLTTMDWVVVKRKDIPAITSAFREIVLENCDVTLQADAIDKLLKEDKTFIAIGWNQTSVSEGWEYKGETKNPDVQKPYNLKRQKEHWYFSDIKL